MENEPKKNELMKRFELHIEGQTAVLDYAEQGDSVLLFTHTFVPAALRGRNIAAILTRHALEDARRQGKKVVPQCSYVAVFMERNKEYAALLAELDFRTDDGKGR
jgi:Predicted acetyltransferase